MTEAPVTTAPRCAVASERAAEAMAGTAPEASAWLAIEQSGPWGRQALTESHLDPEFGARIAFATHATGVKPLLIRRPGRHADDHREPSSRNVWIAHTGPQRPWLRHLTVHDLTELEALDFAAIGAGREPDIGTPDGAPLLLVCANARRDQCCAIDGLPAAADAAVAFPGRVWECSHLGGHRFSATAVQLPEGYVHGRLDGASATAILLAAERARVPVATLRGRSCLPAAAQAAEIAVRSWTGIEAIDALTSVDLAPGENDTGEHWTGGVTLSGSTHPVAVRTLAVAATRPESCGKEPSVVRSFVVEPSPVTR